jgi:hypothetical protein
MFSDMDFVIFYTGKRQFIFFVKQFFVWNILTFLKYAKYAFSNRRKQHPRSKTPLTGILDGFCLGRNSRFFKVCTTVHGIGRSPTKATLAPKKRGKKKRKTRTIFHSPPLHVSIHARGFSSGPLDRDQPLGSSRAGCSRPRVATPTRACRCPGPSRAVPRVRTPTGPRPEPPGWRPAGPPLSSRHRTHARTKCIMGCLSRPICMLVSRPRRLAAPCSALGAHSSPVASLSGEG